MREAVLLRRRVRPWGVLLALLLLAATTSCGVVYVPLQPYPLIGEGPPPGYTGGSIPERYSVVRDPFGPTDRGVLAAGGSLYSSHEPSCAGCHGSGGRGDGPLSAYLEPQPADFAAPPMLDAFRNRQPYVFWWVSEGVAKSPMPAWQTRMSETERWQVITYAWSLAEQGSSAASSMNEASLWDVGRVVSTRLGLPRHGRVETTRPTRIPRTTRPTIGMVGGAP